MKRYEVHITCSEFPGWEVSGHFASVNEANDWVRKTLPDLEYKKGSKGILVNNTSIQGFDIRDNLVYINGFHLMITFIDRTGV